MPARRIKIASYKLPYKDWAQKGQGPPQDLPPLQPFWQKILLEDSEKAVSVPISDATQDVHDVHDVLDEEHKRINISFMCIDDAMVRADATCDELCHGDEVRVYFDITHWFHTETDFILKENVVINVMST